MQLWRLTSPEYVIWQDLEEAMLPFEREGQPFCPIQKDKSDRKRPIHIMEGHLLFSKPADLNARLIQKAASQKHSGPARLTHKINDLQVLPANQTHSIK